MKATKIISYVGLGLIAAIIITVVILSFVPTKLSPTICSGSQNVVSTNPTAQISIYKYENSKQTKYNMLSGSTNETIKQDYQTVLNKFNDLGSYSIMHGLFLGLTKANQSITEDRTKTFAELQKMTDGYFVEFTWLESQSLLNVDGSIFKDKNGNTQTFTKLAIFVQDKKGVVDNKVYVKTYSSDSSYSYFYYTSYSDTQSLYDLAKSFDNQNKFGPIT